MKVKTSELSGMALCYTVCMIEMPHLVWGKTIGKHHASDQIVVPELPEDKCYSPFTGWDMFGPLIERERITVWNNEVWWHAAYNDGTDDIYGQTPLIAAMRCYCCAKLGDIIDIPEELCQQPNN